MRKMRFLVGFLLAVVVAGCSDDDSPKNIALSGGTQTSQTVYADQTTGAEGISFTATSSWVATVSEVTTTKSGGSSVDWLTLSAYSGGAGTYTLTLTLTENLTGEDRMAKIEIACGGDVITITVEQKATTETGETPDDEEMSPILPGNEQYLVTRIEREHSFPGHTCKTLAYFEYDSQGRIVKCTTEEEGNDNAEGMGTYTFTYNESGFTMSYSGSTGYYSSFASFTTNADGYIMTFTSDDVDEIDGTTYHSEGTLSYDNENYLQQATRSSSDREYTDVAYWEDGNLVKVVNDIYGDGLSSNYIAEMEYGNEDYVNNPLLSIDLNWALAQTEWTGNFGLSGLFVQLYGFVGQRSRLLMTKEYDRCSYSSNDYYTYSYEFDDLNRPTKAVVLEDGDPYETYTITYMID